MLVALVCKASGLPEVALPADRPHYLDNNAAR